MEPQELGQESSPTYDFPKPDFDPTDPNHELLSYRYKAEVDAYKAHLAAVDQQEQAASAVRADQLKTRTAVITDQHRASVANDVALRQAVYTAYVDVTKGQLDRAQARAEFVQTAAAAVGTLYTGVLAFTAFGKGTTTGATGSGAAGLSTLPTQGIIAPIFLGLAIVCATGYLAYFRDPSKDPSADGAREAAETTPDDFLEGLIEWTNLLVGQRTDMLRMAIISFAYGVVTLSLAFIAPLPGSGIALILVVGALLVVLIPVLTAQMQPAGASVAPRARRRQGKPGLHRPPTIPVTYAGDRAKEEALRQITFDAGTKADDPTEAKEEG